MQHVAPERVAQNAILRNAHNGILSIQGGVQCFANIDVEPALHLFLLGCDGFYDFAAQGDLVHRGHALLPIQQQRLRRYLLGRLRSAFDGAGLKVHRAPCVQGHQGTDRECAGDGSDQAFDAVFVPHPAALEVR